MSKLNIILRKATEEIENRRIQDTNIKKEYYKQNGYFVISADNVVDVYQRLNVDYQDGIDRLGEKLTVIKKLVDKLNLWRVGWGVETINNFDIIVSKYGTNGSYNTEAVTPKIVLRLDSLCGGSRTPVMLVIHEITHVMIDFLVKKSNLSHWEIEALVDKICQLLMEDYIIQKHTVNSDLFKIIDLDYLEHLPERLR